MKFEEVLVELKKFYDDNSKDEDWEEEYAEGVDGFAHDDGNDVPGLGSFTEVEQHGGEDEGSDWFSVKHFPDLDMYLKVSGYYASYSGTDFDNGWECVEEVKPVQVMVTEYKSIDSPAE